MCRHVLDHLAGDHRCPPRAEREEHLLDAERPEPARIGAPDERLGFLVVQLEDGYMSKHTSDLAVRTQPAERRRADEALRVEQQAPSLCRERGESLWRKIRSHERSHVHPGCIRSPFERALDRPWLSHRILSHDPPISFVVEAVGGGRSRRVPAHGQAERSERREQVGSIRLGAGGGHRHLRGGLCKRPRRVEDDTARARLIPADDVARQVTDHGDVGQTATARSVLLREIVATVPAIAKDARKLGTVAPRPQLGGSSLSTRSTHQAGPVGKSHW